MREVRPLAAVAQARSQLSLALGDTVSRVRRRSPGSRFVTWSMAIELMTERLLELMALSDDLALPVLDQLDEYAEEAPWESYR